LELCPCWRSSGAEQLPCKQWVGGSIPPASARFCDRLQPRGLHRMPAGSGRYPSGQRGQTVNLLAYAFGGSNPPLPTIATIGLSPARSVGGLFKMGVAPFVAINRSRGEVHADCAFCGNSSAVERQPSKLGVAGSNPVSRSTVAKGFSTARSVGGLFEMGAAPTGPFNGRRRNARAVARFGAGVRTGGSSADGARTYDSIRSAHVAQLAEHALGKGEVSGSIPDMGSRFFSPTKRGAHGR
jgi:hypothetical protein